MSRVAVVTLLERDLRDVLHPSRQGGLAVCSEVGVVHASEISGPL